METKPLDPADADTPDAFDPADISAYVVYLPTTAVVIADENPQ